MPTRTIDTVVFDLDGVIVNSAPLMIRAEHAAAAAVSKDYMLPYIMPKIDWASLHGLNRHDMAAKLFGLNPDSPIAEEYRRRVVGLVLSEAKPETVPLYDGIKSFMGFVMMRGCRIGVATSSSRPVLDTYFHIHELDEIQREFTVAAFEAGENKPSPAPYLEVMCRLNANPYNTLVLDDSLPGITAGRMAGALVAAPTTTHTEEFLRVKTGAHIVAGTYSEMAQQVRPLLRY